MFVNWDDEIPNIWENKIQVPNHQPEALKMFEGSLEAKLPTIWRDENGTARKKLGRGESQQGQEKR